MMYHIKTDSGYVYAVDRGRYGRFGDMSEAWTYCEKHASEVVQSYGKIEELGTVEKIPCNGNKCNRCELTRR